MSGSHPYLLAHQDSDPDAVSSVDLDSTPAPVYFMDSATEAWRLERKTDVVAVGQHLLITGLRAGMRCVDVACGSGIVTRLMAKIAGPELAVGVDQSPTRLEVAEELARTERQSVSFLQGRADALPLPDASSEYTHARMLFQYLSPTRRAQALREMTRITSPGGRVVVIDLDQQLTRLHPMPNSVRVDLHYALRILRQRTGFDPNVGRKLVRDLRKAGLTQVTAQIEPYQRYLGGPLPERDQANWEEKLRTATTYLTQVTGDTVRWERFRSAYLKALQAPDAFYCADVVIASGVCA